MGCNRSGETRQQHFQLLPCQHSDVGPFGSILVLFGSAVACVYLDRPDILPFAAGEAGGIIAVALVVGIRKVILNKKQ